MRPAGQSKQIATNAAAKAHLICMAESRGSGESGLREERGGS